MSRKHLALGFVALCSLFIIATSAFAQSLAFTTNTYAVGRNPDYVVAADVNGDGKIDLISANWLDNTLTVLTNNGSGIFSSNATYTVGLNPYCVVVADVNGDGKPDLISANGGDHTLTVLTNNGFGVFGSNATYAVSQIIPRSLVAADINGDGKLDLVCAEESGYLTVLTNNGFGVFGSNATYTVGHAPSCVVAADVNGDGKVDLICANRNDDTLTVLTNNGFGVFGSNATYTVGSQPFCVAPADINGDGTVDLISANQGDNTLTVLTNNGFGVFGSNATYTVGISALAKPQWVIVTNINGNGKLDLISANAGEASLTVLTNNGSGTFGSNATLNVGIGPECVVAADVNDDGHLDLVSANYNDNTLTVLTQIPPPQPLTAFLSSTYTVGIHPDSVVAADVNGDGKVDLISVNQGDNTLTVLTNNGFGVFGSNATYTVGIHPDSVVAADVNGDGKVDLISANQGDNTLTVLTNNGFGVFGSNATLIVGSNPDYVAAADVNGDGKIDLISANFGVLGGGNTLTVLTNNGNGIFGSNATLSVGEGPEYVIATDVNGDGKVDLISANQNQSFCTLTVLTNNGNGVFGSNATISVGTNFNPMCVVAADVNGDGKVDLISANSGDDSLTIYTNNGSGIFGFNATLTVFGKPYSVVAADIYGDGKIDLISANDGANTLTIFTNNGTGIFGLNATLNVGIMPERIATADINGDGKVDLISPNWGSTMLTVLTQTIVAPPVLNIATTDTNTVAISWSLPLYQPSIDFTLQTNFDLTATNWASAGYSISTSNGTNQSATVSSPPGNLFFRLIH